METKITDLIDEYINFINNYCPIETSSLLLTYLADKLEPKVKRIREQADGQTAIINKKVY